MMTAIKKILMPPKRNELSLLKRGLVVRCAFIAVAVLFNKNFTDPNIGFFQISFEVLAAYVIFNAPVIERRFSKSKNEDRGGDR